MGSGGINSKEDTIEVGRSIDISLYVDDHGLVCFERPRAEEVGLAEQEDFPSQN